MTARYERAPTDALLALLADDRPAGPPSREVVSGGAAARSAVPRGRRGPPVLRTHPARGRAPSGGRRAPRRGCRPTRARPAPSGLFRTWRDDEVGFGDALREYLAGVDRGQALAAQVRGSSRRPGWPVHEPWATLDREAVLGRPSTAARTFALDAPRSAPPTRPSTRSPSPADGGVRPRRRGPTSSTSSPSIATAGSCSSSSRRRARARSSPRRSRPCGTRGSGTTPCPRCSLRCARCWRHGGGWAWSQPGRRRPHRRTADRGGLGGRWSERRGAPADAGREGGRRRPPATRDRGGRGVGAARRVPLSAGVDSARWAVAGRCPILLEGPHVVLTSKPQLQ
jgi:hypothetical protein